MKNASYERGGINGAAFPGLGQKSLSRVKDWNKKNESLSMASAEKTINNRYSRNNGPKKHEQGYDDLVHSWGLKGCVSENNFQTKQLKTSFL